MSSLVVDNLVIEYATDGYRLRAVDGLSFDANAGEIVLLLGPSGSGKTSLLSALAGILTPASGAIDLDGTRVTDLRGTALARYRRDTVGIVFQAFNLIPSATSLENVAAPLLAAGVPWSKARARAGALLETVRMSDRAHHRPGRLSGGQQQRVALARALAHDPPLLIADEPTANLDYVNAESIIALLRELRSAGRLIVISTHDDRLTPIADRSVHMLPESRAMEQPPQRVQYTAGEIIFEQGTRGHLVYVIEEGRVDIVRDGDDGARRLLATLEAPNYFGELGPMLGFPRSATTRAATNVTLTAYNLRDFRAMVSGGMPADGERPAPRRRATAKKRVLEQKAKTTAAKKKSMAKPTHRRATKPAPKRSRTAR